MRSLLFVPGDSEKKLEKGLASVADALIVDLEDSVSADRKAAARATALAFLQNAKRDGIKFLVRVNALDTGLTDDDLDVIVAGRPDAIMLPKAAGGVSVAHLHAKLSAREAIAGLPDGSIGIVALATETAASLFTTGSYGGASPRLTALTWGAEDLSADIGAEANRDDQGLFLDPYRLARTLCLAGAAAAGVSAIDTVYVDFRNDAGLRRECEDARRDGFTAKMAIHPAQVATINDVFTPTPAAIAQAREIIAAFAAQPGAGVVGIGGKMYDRPHLVRANRVLERASEAKT
jgi:citrate lyase subunit beta/citryl-CoA lyase